MMGYDSRNNGKSQFKRISADIITVGTPSGSAPSSGDIDISGDFKKNGVAISGTPSIRSVSGTTDILLAGDNGNVVRYTNGSAITITVPPGLGVGFSCVLIQRGAGAFTVEPAMGVTVDNRPSQLSSAGQNAMCSILADAANAFIFAGDTA